MMPRVSGVILAGGKSRRMGGSPKALLPFGGRPLIEHIAETLRSVLPDCLVVTNSPELYAFLGLPWSVTPFRRAARSAASIPASGPRRATPRSASPATCPSCRRPCWRISPSRAGEADVVIPDAGGELQTLHAVYGKACLPAMERRLRAGTAQDRRASSATSGSCACPAERSRALRGRRSRLHEPQHPRGSRAARALWGRQPAGPREGRRRPAGGDGEAVVRDAPAPPAWSSAPSRS